ncbi:unnamed protein product [Cuscuta epithymum]|uniref:Uncharacterized protein n=1 Tax=Cuscuta epithymum TaxID=186058 RepID=A0AAV0C1U9_9ASTE|nr:unnamed protein product [Cuscuta epithymum]
MSPPPSNISQVFFPHRITASTRAPSVDTARLYFDSLLRLSSSPVNGSRCEWRTDADRVSIVIFFFFISSIASRSKSIGHFRSRSANVGGQRLGYVRSTVLEVGDKPEQPDDLFLRCLAASAWFQIRASVVGGYGGGLTR